MPSPSCPKSPPCIILLNKFADGDPSNNVLCTTLEAWICLWSRSSCGIWADHFPLQLQQNHHQTTDFSWAWAVNMIESLLKTILLDDLQKLFTLRCQATICYYLFHPSLITITKKFSSWLNKERCPRDFYLNFNNYEGFCYLSLCMEGFFYSMIFVPSLLCPKLKQSQWYFRYLECQIPEAQTSHAISTNTWHFHMPFYSVYSHHHPCISPSHFFCCY